MATVEQQQYLAKAKEIYREGVRFRSMWYKTKLFIVGRNPQFFWVNEGIKIVWNSHDLWIFTNGKWADVIDEGSIKK